jgi:hypothetical protein
VGILEGIRILWKHLKPLGGLIESGRLIPISDGSRLDRSLDRPEGNSLFPDEDENEDLEEPPFKLLDTENSYAKTIQRANGVVLPKGVETK